jgi:hypothetical protein
MTEQPTALRLADWLDAEACGGSNWNAKMNAAAAELRRLHADAEESEALRERLSALLTSTAIALRGPAPELVSWSWHDLPERAAALVAQRDALLDALHDMLNAENDYPYGGMSQSEIAAINKARAAIKKAEEA